MSFGAPQWFWGLLLIPVLIALFVRAEQRGIQRLREFVSARLLPQLAGTVNRPRRVLRFAMQLAGVALVVLSLAQPRWGYTFLDVKRKGLDLLIAIDTSRSMLSNDVQPNRIERVKLAAHDLISELQGDRVGLIAFAGRAFLQAPLTIDYGAATESINDLDTKTIPEGGTKISEAITLATTTFGKSATGNRALIIFTDGEELSGDAVKSAKAAADAGVRIFTVGVGTQQGSLIPLTSDDGGAAFVKDASGQVVKSKLDEKVLEEIAQATTGFYLHLENGPRAMQRLYTEGLAKMQAADIDTRMSRQPIERYEWPLGAAIAALALSILIGERKRVRTHGRFPASVPAKIVAATAGFILVFPHFALSAAPGLSAYRDGKFNEAYGEFQETLKTHPRSNARDELQFDSATAAYKMKDYGKALELFSQALLSPDAGLQSKSHYNLGNTLYQRGEEQKKDDKKLGDWTNALNHYEQTLKIEPNNKEAKENYDYVKKKIDNLKNKKQQQPSPTPTPTPTPSPSPSASPQQDKKNQQSQQQQDGKDQQQPSQDQQSQEKKEQDKNGQSQTKKDSDKAEQPKPGETPSPSPGDKEKEQQQKGEGDQSPTPGPGQGSPTPSATPEAGEGSEENATPSPAPSASPQKKMAGELKEAGEEKPNEPSDKTAQMAETEPEKEGEMSERQALALLESMKNEEARVQLDERKAARHVYKDW
ncbi:MAG: VWA domain-containing protein [Verrucomicrobiota bacterium]